MQSKHVPLRGIAAMASCAFLWSLAGIFIKVLPWNPVLIAGARSIIASLFIMVWLRKPHFHWSFAQVAAGVLNACTMMLFIYANKTTTAANAILLQYSAPVFTAVAGALILKEKPKIEQLAAFVFVAIGMGVLFAGSSGGTATLLGDVASAISGITFGLYFVFMRMQKDGSPLESILLSHWITAAIMLPLALFMPAPVVTPIAIGALLGLGLLQIGLASVLFAYGIKRVTAVQGVLVSIIEPAFNPVWVFLATGESPSLPSIAGGVIIVCAVTAASVINARRLQQQEAKVTQTI